MLRRGGWHLDLAGLSVRRPKTVVALFLLALALAAAGIGRLKEEDDLLVFLPTTDPDVALFKDVSRRFGGLRVALVGVEAPAGQDVFTAETLGRIRKAHQAIKNVRGVDGARSLHNAVVIVSSPLGVKFEPLLPDEVPKAQ